MKRNIFFIVVILILCILIGSKYIYEKKFKPIGTRYNFNDENLSENWNNIWEDIYNNDEILTENHIKDINFLLQPVFLSSKGTEVNPLSCFFTSYYEDVKDINLSNFLRYYPYGEVLEEISEFDDLKKHKNWPFGEVNSSSELPVPIHRYKKEIIQNMFSSYAGISLDEMTGVGFDDLIYIESTDSYYNFTSDFGPGVFNCIDGKVEKGVIKLNGNNSVLTIEKNDEKYVIKSFLKK